MSEFTTVKLDRDVHKEARAYCRENGMTLSGLVRKLLIQHIHGAVTAKGGYTHGDTAQEQ